MDKKVNEIMAVDEDTFLLELKVRDYECDAANGVNNAVYLNYFEFARFEYLREKLKWDLPALTAQGIGFVVASIQIEFLRSLEIGDQIIVETKMERESKRRIIFTQAIYRLPNRKIVTKARVVTAPINTKTLRSETPEMLEELFGERFAVPIDKDASR